MKNREKLVVGVLAVQGDFAEHISILEKIGVDTREVRLPKDLDGVDAVIIPGGESTTLRKLFDLYGLTDAITNVAKKGTPIWGTCAGMIMLAKKLTDDRPEPLHLMNITVTRNAFGRQVDSFEADIDFPKVGKKPFKAVFIRAPAIDKVEEGVEILGKLSDGSPVALLEGNLMVTSFHPELTDDPRFHKFFLSLVKPLNGRNRDKE